MVPGDDTVVRRQVFAGGIVPDNWILEDDDTEEVPDTITGLGAAAPAYKHQVDEHGQVTEEHQVEVDEEGQQHVGGRGRRGRKPAESSSKAT
jgi:hypothetical protein